MKHESKSIGIVGARGYVGAELIKLIAAHPGFDLGFVTSRELDGQRVADHVHAYQGEMRYSDIEHAALGQQKVDAYVLALPNGTAAACVAGIEAANPDAVILDLSADYRFDDGWFYGLPELTRASYAGQRRISNPGCYATAMQLAIAPMCDAIVGPVQCFGVSGYSGAGTSRSDKNDPNALRDNLIPYASTDHLHEREVTRYLLPVEFMPHVAPHFRGLTITANLHLESAITPAAAHLRYQQHYANEPLVSVVEHAPWVSRLANRHHVDIGGFAVSADGKRLVVVSALDNLLKGAATQALQNFNLAFGYPEITGIPVGTVQGR